MGGLELAQQVRDRFPECRVLLMSGNFDVHESGFEFIAKPFVVDGLARRIGEVLDAASQAKPELVIGAGLAANGPR